MRVLKKWNDTSARQAELKNVQKSPRMKRTWQKIEFSKHRNQTETETETETETDGQQTNSKTGDSLSDKARRKKKTKRNAISRKWNNTKKTKNRKKKTLNKKPETKTIAARCKRGGRESRARVTTVCNKLLPRGASQCPRGEEHRECSKAKEKCREKEKI